MHSPLPIFDLNSPTHTRTYTRTHLYFPYTNIPHTHAPTLAHASTTHTGFINKVFFSDVPTFKATKSDVVIDKKKLAAAAKAREAEMLELKEKDRLKNQQAVLANSGTALCAVDENSDLNLIANHCK
jgi:hypothetical protein